jgi:hypothetical protein
MPDAIPSFRCQIFTVPKDGSNAEEYEDYGRADLERGRFAIADGATETSFAKHWAHLLVDRFLEEPVVEAGQWETWLPPLQEVWRSKVAGLTLPWFAREKADQGACAAFLGVVAEPDGSWHAVAVGDCCLFHIREHKRVLEMFPVRSSAEFGVTPPLLGACMPANAVDERRLQRTWVPGDYFLLMTDALAHSVLNRLERRLDIDPKDDPLRAATQEHFTERVERLRASNQLKNDDVTLMKIEIPQTKLARANIKEVRDGVAPGE